MNNLCLPMKVINITQHSSGSYSHPNNCLDLAGSDNGVDFAFAMGDYWRCIAGPWGSHTYFFTACDAKGNAVKVHCADDIDRIVTVAMTHSNFEYVKPPTIGKIYKNGEPLYEEGTYGKATGNHIHYEVASGLQYSKYYDEAMGVYRMRGELMPEMVCYICDAFSRVANMGGAIMKHCSTIEYKKQKMNLKDGYGEYVYDGVTIHTYKQTTEKIAVVACEYGKVCSIKDVWLPKKRIRAIINASYFMMSGDNGYLGRVQGFKNGTLDKVDARPSNPSETGSYGDKPYMDLVYTKSGKIVIGDLFSWDYPINEVVFGVSPAGVEIMNGQSVNKYSPAVGYGKITTPNTQTMLIRCEDGKFAFATVEKGLAPIPTLQDWGLIFGFNNLSVYDSGGSTQMMVDGKIKQKSTDNRKCPVWFVFYEDEEPSDIPDEAIGTIHCATCGMNIRDAVRGNVMHTVKKGEQCELLGFIDGIQSDGYQWVYTRSGGIKGYSQFDSAAYWIELN